MAKKRVRKNYYKNSRYQKKSHRLRRFVMATRVVVLGAFIGGTSLLFILAHDALTQSSYFKAKSITVDGNHRLSEKAILRQANVRLGDNILGVNLNVVRNNLLGDPWIVETEIERDLPDAIHIHVRERVPVAVVELNRPFYLSESGEIFKPVGSSDNPSLPRVTGLRLSDIDLKYPRHCSALQAILKVVRLSKLHGSVLPFHSLYHIHVDREMGLTLFGFEDAVAVKLGYGDYASKFDRLRDMIRYLRQKDGGFNVRCVDLNDSDRVVIKPGGRASLLGVCFRKEM